MDENSTKDLENLKKAFPNHNIQVLQDYLQRCKSLEAAVEAILSSEQSSSSTNYSSTSQAPNHAKNFTARLNSVNFRPQKLIPKSNLDHLFLPGRLMPYETNLSIFGTFVAGENDDDASDNAPSSSASSLPTAAAAKSQDSKYVSNSNNLFGSTMMADMTMSMVRSTPMDAPFNQYLPWSSTRFSSGTSWRCSFSSD